MMSLFELRCQALGFQRGNKMVFVPPPLKQKTIYSSPYLLDPEDQELISRICEGKEQSLINDTRRDSRDDGLTLAEIGEKLGLSWSRIRQIEKKALRKIRHPSISRKLREFW